MRQRRSIFQHLSHDRSMPHGRKANQICLFVTGIYSGRTGPVATGVTMGAALTSTLAVALAATPQRAHARTTPSSSRAYAGAMTHSGAMRRAPMPPAGVFLISSNIRPRPRRKPASRWPNRLARLASGGAVILAGRISIPCSAGGQSANLSTKLAVSKPARIAKTGSTGCAPIFPTRPITGRAVADCEPEGEQPPFAISA